jgi:DNA-binding NtrC family response regulator
MIRNVLIVDDEPLAREYLAEYLGGEGMNAVTATDAADGFRLLSEGEFDLVITDLRMPGDDGLALLRRIRLSGRDLPVIVQTAYGSVDAAVAALKEGAFDFLTKPLKPEQIDAVVRNVARFLEGNFAGKGVRVELDRPCATLPSDIPMVGRAPAMRALVDTAIRVARSRATVLITGESGTGKELFARLVHRESPRRGKPFVRVNCAALAETLLESELFGHERGAFTGAVARREGRFEMADGGTLFLDEIGETSPALQAKLLRVLEEREFERVGGTKTLTTDVRVVAATNRDLEKEIEEGRFREDLFYRLKVVQLRIPPLRERREDVDALAQHFLEKYSRENGSRVRRIGDDALALLRAHSWPGNVRELENTIERAVVLDAGEILEARQLAIEIGRDGAAPQLDVSAHVGRTLDDLERALILRTLESTGNHRKEAARLLGVTPRTLTNKIAQYRSEGIHVGAPNRGARAQRMAPEMRA